MSAMNSGLGIGREVGRVAGAQAAAVAAAKDLAGHHAWNGHKANYTHLIESRRETRREGRTHARERRLLGSGPQVRERIEVVAVLDERGEVAVDA